MSDNRPIGVFDSGLGGLYATAHISRLMPRENIVYLGDTARVPYGTRSRDTIIGYAEDDVRFLLSKDVKMILAACGTVSSVALDKIKESSPVPTFGIVEGAVESAMKATKSGRVAVIGTDATIGSGVFEKMLYARGANFVISRACPLLVPLVECGFCGRDNVVASSVCRSYLEPIKEAGVDTLILGCTHFPILYDVISDILCGVSLIDTGRVAAETVARYILQSGSSADVSRGDVRYYVTDSADGFSAAAKIFVGGAKICAETVEITK